MDVEQNDDHPNHVSDQMMGQDSDKRMQSDSSATMTMDWDQFIDELLPDAPDSSKFTKLDFVSPSFVVDAFIEKRKDEPLDRLRELLTTYSSKIRAASVSIINEDYLDLIHLSTNVIGVGKCVDKVLQPLTHAHDDVLTVRNEISAMIQSLEQKMSRLREIRRKKSDIEKMINLDVRLRDMEQRLETIRSSKSGRKELEQESAAESGKITKSESDPVKRLIAIEHLKADLLDAERTLQSITSKSEFLFALKHRFTSIGSNLQNVTT
jgi:hypothetical protein